MTKHMSASLHVRVCWFVIEEMCLEVEPVRCYIAAERTLAAVSGGMTAAMHVEEGTVTEHRATRAHKHWLSLTKIGQDLLVREVRKQMHEMCFRIITTASSGVSHFYVRLPLSTWKQTHTTCSLQFQQADLCTFSVDLFFVLYLCCAPFASWDRVYRQYEVMIMSSREKAWTFQNSAMS